MNAGAIIPIIPVTSITVGLVVTPLLATKDLSAYEELLFFFLNDDLVNTFSATVETGQTVDALDAEFIPTLLVPVSAAGKAGQRSLVYGPSQIRQYYRVSAIATGAAVNGRWGLYGTRRLVQGAERGFR